MRRDLRPHLPRRRVVAHNRLLILMAQNSQLSQYPPEEVHLRWGLSGSCGIHLTIAGAVLLLAFLTHVKSLEELMRDSGSIATNGPAPEEPMEVVLQPDDTPPPPTLNPDFIRQVEKPKPPEVVPPKPPPVQVQKPVPQQKPRYTAPRATGSGETNTVSRLVVGSGNFPAPTYPYSARANRETGTVLIAIQFDGSGGIENAEVANSSGYDDLDSNTRIFIRAHWHDPSFAGRSVTVPIQYKL